MNEKIEKAKKVFNVGDCAMEQLDYILYAYQRRAFINCDEEIASLLRDMFKILYNSDNLDKHSPQKNYCLLGLTSVIGKLTRGSKVYNQETKDAIYNLMIDFNTFYSQLIQKDEVRENFSNSVYAVNALDKMVTNGTYNEARYVNNLASFAQLMFNSTIENIEYRGDYGDKAKENIEHLAKEPQSAAGFDLFAIDVPRNDLVLEIVEEDLQRDLNHKRI